MLVLLMLLVPIIYFLQLYFFIKKLIFINTNTSIKRKLQIFYFKKNLKGF